MISTKEYQTLYEIINLKEETLEKVAERFTRLFAGQSYYALFRGCYTLSHLLRLNLLTRLQRLLSIFLILEMYRSEGVKKNPFGGILFQIYNKTTDQYQKKFVAEMLVDNKRDKYSKLKADVLAEEAEVFSEVYRYREQMENIQKGWIQSAPKMPLTQSNEIHNTVVDFNLKDRRFEPPQQPLAKDSIKEQEINCEAFAANYLRPLPQFIEIKYEQFVWLTPGIVHDVSWDSSYEKPNKLARIKALLSKAENSPLQVDEVIELLKIFDEYPYIFWNELSIGGVEEMANKNPYITAEIYIRLYGHPKFQSFLTKLLSLKINTNTIHVVTMFLSKCLLPAVVVEFFINTSISQCLQMDNTAQTEKMANVLASLVKKCVDLKWVDPRQVEEKSKKMFQKFPKSEVISNLIKVFT